MAESGQIESNAAAPALLQDADSLLDYLRGCEYPVGVDHYLRVHRLLASLAARGECPEQANSLDVWIRPLVCQSPRQQEKFDGDFHDWLRLHGAGRERVQPPEEPVEQVIREVDHRWRQWLWIGSLAAFLAIGIVVFLLLRTGAPAPANPPKNPPNATESPVRHPAPKPGTTVVVVVFFLCAFLAAGLEFIMWRRSRMQAFLVQREGAAPGAASSLTVAADVVPPIYNSRLLESVAQGFGAYRRLPSEDLNISGSVASTAREAGRFVPVYADRPSVPEYLILIDRGSSADLFARFAAGIVRSLRENNIAVDLFYFDRVPQQCYTERGHRPVTARELTEQFSDHRLLIFSDGAGFVNPLTKRHATSMSVFASWQVKTLLTPNPREYWGLREQAFREEGWNVFVAGQEEVSALAQEIEPNKVKKGFVPGVQASIAENQWRWLHRSSPPPEEIANLLMELRISLGASGFYWLCACAAYPAVDWVVTLYLGVNLQTEDGRPLLHEPAFLALSRLPWFRYGRLPKWLRLTLLGALSGEQMASVRQALQAFLLTGTTGPLHAYRLEFQNDLRRPLTWLARHFVRGHPAGKEEEDPLHDRVFLEFLSGANPAALPLPERIANGLGGTANFGIGILSTVLAPAIQLLRAIRSAVLRSVDRRRAIARAGSIRRSMSGVDYLKASRLLPQACLALVPDLSAPARQQLLRTLEALDRSVERLRLELAYDHYQEKVEDNDLKSMMLGLELTNVVGADVLAAAVESLGDQIRFPGYTAPAAPADGLTPATSAIVAVLALAGVNYCLRNGISLVLPAISRELRLDSVSITFTYSSLIWAYTLCVPFAGMAADRFGTRRVVGLGLLLSTAATAWAAAAQNLTALLASRVLVGVGISVVVPAYCAIFARYPERRRGLCNGLFEFISRVTSPAFASLSAVFLVGADWRLFAAGIAVAGAILAIAWIFVDRSKAYRSAVGGVGMTLRNRTALGCFAAYSAYSFCLSTVISWIPTLLRNYGGSAAESTTFSTRAIVVLGVSALLSGWLSDWLPRQVSGNRQTLRKRFVVYGLLLMAVSGAFTLSNSVTATYAAGFGCAASMGLVGPSLWSLLQSAAPTGRAGTWGGIQALFGSLAGSLTTIFSSTLFYSRVPLATVAAPLGAGLAAYLIRTPGFSSGKPFTSESDPGRPPTLA